MPLDPSSLKFWEAVAEWGFIFVIVGVAGEGVEIFIKLFLRKLYDRKKFCLDVIGAVFWVILVIALAVEFWGSHKAMLIARQESDRLNSEAGAARKEAGEAVKKASEVNKLAADANERAATNELRVAELVSSNLNLQIRLEELKKPRRITPKRKEDFIEFLKDKPKFPVKVYVFNQPDNETANFAHLIRLLLNDAGYSSTEMPDVIRFPEQFVFTKFSEDSSYYDVFVVFYGNEGEPANWPGVTRVEGIHQPGVRTRNELVLFDMYDPKVAPYTICNALQSINITTAWHGSLNTNIVKLGDWALLVMPKIW